MSIEVAIRNPIPIPSSLEKAGVTVVEQHGVRAVVIPEAVKATHNVVQPVDEIAQSDPDWSPRLVVVDLSGPQYSYAEANAQALTKNGILLLAHAAGIDVDVDMINRSQLRDEEIGFKATATMRRSDGTMARWTASKIADVTTEKSAVGKAHLPAKTESKAILRAVSLALQLQRGGYTKEQLRKPFLIVGVSSTPADPEVRRLRALQAGDALAGRRSLPAPTVEVEPDEAAPVAQLAPPTDVVDHVPASVPPVAMEDDVAGEPPLAPSPVRGEMPPDVAAAGDTLIGFGAAGNAGMKVCELSDEHLTWLAVEYQPTPAHAQDRQPVVEAARKYRNWKLAQA